MYNRNETYDVFVDRRTLAWAKNYSWFLNTDGYVFRNVTIWHRRWKRRTKTYRQYLHREIMGLKQYHKRVVHHKDGKPIDCRFRNMEIMTSKKNALLAIAVSGERPLWASRHLR